VHEKPVINFLQCRYFLCLFFKGLRHNLRGRPFLFSVLDVEFSIQFIFHVVWAFVIGALLDCVNVFPQTFFYSMDIDERVPQGAGIACIALFLSVFIIGFGKRNRLLATIGSIRLPTTCGYGECFVRFKWQTSAHGLRVVQPNCAFIFARPY